MKCYNCGGSFVDLTGTVDLPSVALGSFKLNNVSHSKCFQCGEVLLPDDTWELADQKENDLINDFLMNLPVKEYIGASAVASILNMSRQGLHKHRRIRRGFIYSIMHEGKRLYSKRSVEMYKETNDGRFLLSETISQEKTEYVFVPVVTDIGELRYTKEDTVSPISYKQDSELAIAHCH
ncbi:MAG: hypothetical protein Q3M30_12950 [Candidatus Electrothrix sp. Rat3]|nr:hypothetical protein [Candidatus Electrothrix rattekaaiensis]